MGGGREDERRKAKRVEIRAGVTRGGEKEKALKVWRKNLRDRQTDKERD